MYDVTFCVQGSRSDQQIMKSSLCDCLQRRQWVCLEGRYRFVDFGVADKGLVLYSLCL